MEYPDSPKVAKVVALVKKPPKKPVQLRAKPPVDDQFNATLEFSPAFGDDAGRTYAAVLVDPEPNEEYYWRCRIEQHRVDPLLQGFRTLWDPPPGWTFVDGNPAFIYDEAISNPLVITRVVLAPAEPNNDVGFLVVMTRKYKP
jgi:hypothetical protein